MGIVADLARTLDQELLALTRGASLECLVCGEFVLHRAGGVIACPECGTELREEGAAVGALHFSMQAG
jgi:hypothetical protein